jgi:ABC transporter substrate binding protein
VSGTPAPAVLDARPSHDRSHTTARAAPAQQPARQLANEQETRKCILIRSITSSQSDPLQPKSMRISRAANMSAYDQSPPGVPRRSKLRLGSQARASRCEFARHRHSDQLSRLSIQAVQPDAVRTENRLSLVGLGTRLSANYRAFRSGLAAFGYAEGKNIRVLYRFANGNTGDLSTLTVELASLGAVIIVTNNTTTIRAAHNAAPNLPIVSWAAADPVSMGSVAAAPVR